MGFMAGFGTAFSRQIEIGEERRAQQKADAFRLKYADFISQRNKVDEWKREDTKAVNKAEAILKRTNADRRILPWVIEQVRGGADEDDIVTSVTTGKFDFTQQGGKTEVKPVDQQTVDSGMAPAETPEVPQTPEAPQPASNTELLHNNPQNPATKVKFSDKLRELGAGMEQRRQQRLDEYATNEVASTAGVSPEDVQNTIKGDYQSQVDTDTSGITFTPAPPQRKADPLADPEASAVELAQAQEAFKTDPTEQNKARLDAAVIRDQALKNQIAFKEQARANADAQGGFNSMVVVIDPVTKVGTTYSATPNEKGEFVTSGGEVLKGARPLSKAEQEQMLKMNSSTEVPKYLEKTASVTSMVSDFKDAYDIIKADQRVLAKSTSTVAQAYARITTEAQAIAETMSKNGFESGEKEIEDMVNRWGLEARSDPSNLAAKASLFQALNVKMAYTLSRLEGQSSSGQSNKDVDRFMSMLEGTKDPESFAQRMSNMIMAQVNELQQQGELLNQYNSDLNNYKQAFGYYPGVVVPNPKDVITGSGNSKVTEGYKILQESADQGNGLINSTPDTSKKSTTQDGVPEGIDPLDWEWMNEEEKKLFLNQVPGDPNSPVRG